MHITTTLRNVLLLMINLNCCSTEFSQTSQVKELGKTELLILIHQERGTKSWVEASGTLGNLRRLQQSHGGFLRTKLVVRSVSLLTQTQGWISDPSPGSVRRDLRGDTGCHTRVIPSSQGGPHLIGCWDPKTTDLPPQLRGGSHRGFIKISSQCPALLNPSSFL